MAEEQIKSYIPIYRKKLKNLNDNFDKVYSQFNIGDTIKVTVSRDGILKGLYVPIKKYHRYSYILVKLEKPTDKQKMIYNKWLDIKQ